MTVTERREEKREEQKPKPQDKSASNEKANSTTADQVSTQSQSSPGPSMSSEDIVSAIKELKTEIKGDNDGLRKVMNHIGTRYQWQT